MSRGARDVAYPSLAKRIAQFVPRVKSAREGQGGKNGTSLARKSRILNSDKGAVEGGLGPLNGSMHYLWGGIRGKPNAIVDPQQGVNHVRGCQLLDHEGHETFLDAFEQEIDRIFAKVPPAPLINRW